MGQSVYNFVDLCVILGGLNGCGIWWEDRNQAGKKPQQAGPHVTLHGFRFYVNILTSIQINGQNWQTCDFQILTNH